MLKSLHINNYALIDKVQIDFQSGFSIITGETGAGKSIMLGALSLLLGQRADSQILRNADQKCVIEGVFDNSKFDLKPFFDQNELEYDNQTIIRRLIYPNGKSRAFVNDLPVNLYILKDLGNFLVDIHSQHNNLLLNNPDFQLQMLDSYAGNQSLLTSYQKEYRHWKTLSKAYSDLQSQSKRDANEIEYLQHRFEMLDKANLVADEQEALEQEHEMLSHSEEIKVNLGQMLHILHEEEQINVLQRLRDASQSAAQIAPFFGAMTEIGKRLETAYIDLKDISTELSDFIEDIDYEPARLEQLNQRINLLFSLQQTFRVNSVAELIEIRDKIAAQLHQFDSYDELLEQKLKALKQQEAELKDLADQLFEKRQKAAPKIETRILKMLKQVGMPNARFQLLLTETKDYTANGLHSAQVLFSANSQGVPQEINKIASGGEISRVMLAIKSLMSQNSNLPTIIFDEIDTGVSGDIAAKMGMIMRQMSENMQVISITHLPQVAARGQNHYLVYKKDSKTDTRTEIKLLSQDERLTEIAKMLSGENLTDAALHNARELLNTPL